MIRGEGHPRAGIGGSTVEDVQTPGPAVPQTGTAENATVLERFFDFSLDLLATASVRDGTWLRVNPAFARVLGWTPEDLVGRPFLDLVHAEDRPRSIAATASLATGEPLTEFENRVLCRDGSYRLIAWHTSCRPEEGVLYCAGRDVTDRRRTEAEVAENEERQRPLLAFSDALRDVAEPAAALGIASDFLGRQLGAAQVAYAAVDGTGAFALIDRDWNDGTMTSNAGRHQLSEFGPAFIADLRRGWNVVVGDVRADPRTALPEALSTFGRVGIGAFLNVPLLRDGRLCAVLAVHHPTARDWLEAEVTLVREVAERTWSAFERMLAEAALRESEKTLAADLADMTLLRDLGERLVTEESVEAIHEEILAAAISIMRSEAGTVQVYDPETGSLVLLVTQNIEQGMTDHFRRVEASSRTACGMALRSGRRTFMDFDEADTDESCAMHVAAGLRSAQATPLLSRNGTPLGMLNTHWRALGHRPTERQLRFLDLLARQAADLIEQRQAQAALRANELKFRGFAENSADVLWIADARGERVEYVSPAFERMFGASREGVLDGSVAVLDLVHPEDRASFLSGMPRVLAGEVAIVHYRVVRPVDGCVVHLRDTGFLIHEGGGAVRQVGGVVQDISDIEATRQALEDEKERFRTLAEGIPQLVWRSCDEGMWTWASPQWLEYTGQKQEESHGRRWMEVLHPEDMERTLEAWHAARPHGMLDVEFRVRRASDGAWRWHQSRSVPVRSGPTVAEPSGRIVEWLGTTTDIHDLKQLQAQQDILLAELQHRSRNLLAVVRSIARRSFGASPERNEYDTRLAALGRVQGFLSRSHTWSVPLVDLVQAELDAMGDGHSDRVTVSGPPVNLPGDKVQPIALALHELATNAAKYGAIVQDTARLWVRWHLEGTDGERRLILDWHESEVVMPDGGPTRRGYGSELIERALPYQLGAETRHAFTPDGVHCRITLPIGAFREEGMP